MYNFYFFKFTLEEFLLRPIMFATRQRGNPENMENRRRFRNRYSYPSQEKTELKNYL